MSSSFQSPSNEHKNSPISKSLLPFSEEEQALCQKYLAPIRDLKVSFCFSYVADFLFWIAANKKNLDEAQNIISKHPYPKQIHNFSKAVKIYNRIFNYKINKPFSIQHTQAENKTFDQNYVSLFLKTALMRLQNEYVSLQDTNNQPKEWIDDLKENLSSTKKLYGKLQTFFNTFPDYYQEDEFIKFIHKYDHLRYKISEKLDRITFS
ncbi:MAG: hypothetical protein ACOVOR_01135 [Rhabdochlamydiaceae bacterium]